MDEQAWRTRTDPETLLAFLGPRLSERKARLFACACCRRVLQRIPDPRAGQALAVSEAHADGLASREELGSACSMAWRVYAEAQSRMAPEESFARAIERVCASRLDVAEVVQAARKEDLYSEMNLYDVAFIRSEGRAQAALLREIAGNPFQVPALAPGQVTATVTAVARGIYERLAFDELPILADALEDAGCGDEEILRHCRQGGDHVRGCWVVDCVLGRK